jgi:hypothetical protein
MANTNHVQRFAGDYEKFPETDRELENQHFGQKTAKTIFVCIVE